MSKANPPYQKIEAEVIAKDVGLKKETVLKVLNRVDYFRLSEENQDLRERLERFIEGCR